MKPPELSTAQQQALQQGRGFVYGESYVLMTAELYRRMMGVGTDSEMRQSVEAVEAGLRDVEAGRTHEMESVFRELDETYGVHD